MRILLLVFLLMTPSIRADLRTHAEKSGWKETGRHAEMVSLCRAFARAYPKSIRCEEVGVSPEGREILALVASSDGTLSPARAKAKRKIVVYAQGGIHAGEIEGKDAGFHLLRRVFQERSAKLPPEVVFVFVPIFNVDGHERFGPNHRPNQVGPAEMGWRVTAHNLNLNRDYLKASAPEMRALTSWTNRWDPAIYLDLHTTDGADFQPNISVEIEPLQGSSEALRPLGKILSGEVMTRLRASGHLPLDFYPTFRTDDDPTSGFAHAPGPPRFSNAYWPQRNRFGVLVETHSWKDYANRLKSTEDTLVAFIALAAERARDIRDALAAADRDSLGLAGKQVTLSWDVTERSRTIEFAGYAYEKGKSEISGKEWIRYEPSKPQVWKVPYFDELKPTLVVTAPRAGYLVPAAYARAVAAKLDVHGIEHSFVKKPWKGETEVFRAESFELSKKSFEGLQALTQKGKWSKETRELAAGSLFVPIRQRLSRLVLHQFEPEAPDSLASWGFFNAHYERKEYMDAYVTELVAREMLKDAKIREEFEARLKSPEFAKDADARLEFFYRKHPAWDERYALYPVFKLARAP
jgi:hypothetical protein